MNIGFSGPNLLGMKVNKFLWFLSALCLVLVMGCAGWQKKTAHDKAGDILVSMAAVVNVADSALKVAIEQKSQQVTVSAEFAKALDGYDCMLDEKGEPVGTPRQLGPGLAAGMCFYDMQLRPYKLATIAVGAFRQQLKVAGGIVDNVTTPSGTTQALVLKSLDGALGVVNTIHKLGVQYPATVSAGLLTMCSMVRAVYPEATNCAAKADEVPHG